MVYTFQLEFKTVGRIFHALTKFVGTVPFVNIVAIRVKSTIEAVGNVKFKKFSQIHWSARRKCEQTKRHINHKRPTEKNTHEDEKARSINIAKMNHTRRVIICKRKPFMSGSCWMKNMLISFCVSKMINSKWVFAVMTYRYFIFGHCLAELIPFPFSVVHAFQMRFFICKII